MRILVFWDSITEWYYDFKKWGWVNRLKIFLWKKNLDYEVANLWIWWDQVVDVLKRLDLNIKSFTEKYKSKLVLIFSIWINDTIISSDWNFKWNTKKNFEKEYKELISKSKNYTKDIYILWLSNVNESLVSPFPWSKKNECYKNDRIKEFDKIIKKIAEENNIKYIELFDLLDDKYLEDWIHPNSKWHKKIFKEVYSKFEFIK